MSSIAIILIVISAFMHAGWNLLSKSQRPTAAFFLIGCLAAALILSPALILCRDTATHRIPAQVWMLLLMTGFFIAVYFISLAGAYRAGDMSVAYPLARSSPVIVVLVVTLILGRRDQVTTQCVAGIILVVAGCFLIPLQQFGDLRLKNYLNATCGLAMLTAFGTAGYSILDDEALRQLRTDSQITIGSTRATLLYAFLHTLAASFWLALFVGARRKGRSDLRQVLRVNGWHAAFTGIAVYLTYALILISLAHVRNVSYAAGFRQLSIPLGAAFGILFLKEPPHRPKIAGVAIMVGGLILVAMG